SPVGSFGPIQAPVHPADEPCARCDGILSHSGQPNCRTRRADRDLAQSAVFTASGSARIRPSVERTMLRSAALPVSPPSSGLRHSVTLAALGVVYGDIGTSPLYAVRQSLVDFGDMSEAAILGALSLIVWALVLIVTVKYVAVIMRADNRGEGGLLALTALVLRNTRRGSKRYLWIMGAGLVGAALFYGDGVITPAISVLSAVEGLK